jgi:hypothetical protein
VVTAYWSKSGLGEAYDSKAGIEVCAPRFLGGRFVPISIDEPLMASDVFRPDKIEAVPHRSLRAVVNWSLLLHQVRNSTSELRRFSRAGAFGVEFT